MRSTGLIASPDRRVSIREAFSPEFAPAVEEFVSLLKAIPYSHQRIVLMARKTVCLYYALIKNGELEPLPEEIVISSRALGLESVIEPKSTVAVVDDVIVHGGSALKVAQQVSGLGGDPTLLVISCCSRLLNQEIFSVAPLVAVRELDESQVYRLSREIVCYIQASGITNNVDQPIFYTKVPSSPLAPNLPWVEVTARMQRRKGVRSYTCSLGHRDISDLGLPINFFQKVRIMVDDGLLTLIPFVILPPLGSEEASRIGRWILPEDLFSGIVEHSGGDVSLKLLLCYIRYALAMSLGKEFLRRYGLTEYTIDIRNERLLFSREHTWKTKLRNEAELLSEPLGSLERINGLLRKSQGIIVSRLLSLADSDHFCNGGLSFYEIADILGQKIPNIRRDCEWVYQLASGCLDVMVDEGMLVPFTRIGKAEDGRETVERAYRGGEVFTLTCEDIDRLSVLARKLLSNDDGLKVEHRTWRLMNLAFVIFLRWHHEDDKRDIGISNMTSSDNEDDIERMSVEYKYIPEQEAACLPSGLTLVDMVEQNGAIKCEGGILSLVDDFKVPYDLRDLDAVDKFTGDLCSIEQKAPYNLSNGTATFGDVLEALLNDGHQAYQLRRLQSLVEKIPLAIHSIKFGRNQEALSLASVMYDISDVEFMKNRHDEIASSIANKTKVTQYDFQKYSGAKNSNSVDGRLFRYITKCCQSCAKELEDISNKRKASPKSSLKKRDKGILNMLNDASETIASLIDDSSQNWEGASLKRIDSVYCDVNGGKTKVNISQKIENISARPYGTVEWINSISKKVLEYAKHQMTVLFPEDDPYNAVIPKRMPADSGQVDLEGVYPKRLRHFIADLVSSTPKYRVVVICYRKSTGFPKSQLVNKLKKKGFQEVSISEVGLERVRFYLNAIYNYLLLTPDESARRFNSNQNEAIDAHGESGGNVNNHYYYGGTVFNGDTVNGVKVGGDIFTGDKIAADGGIGKTSAKAVISYGDGQTLKLSGTNETDIKEALDVLESYDNTKNGIKNTVTDIKQYCDNPQQYEESERRTAFQKLKQMVDGVNSLHNLWSWLAPLLSAALKLGTNAF